MVRSERFSALHAAKTVTTKPQQFVSQSIHALGQEFFQIYHERFSAYNAAKAATTSLL